jgi:hypothetical protein
MPDLIRHPLKKPALEHVQTTNGPRIKSGVTISVVERDGPVKPGHDVEERIRKTKRARIEVRARFVSAEIEAIDYAALTAASARTSLS